MTDCEDLIDELQVDVRTQVYLAVIAEAAPVAGMHLDLAELGAERARVAEDLCIDD